MTSWTLRFVFHLFLLWVWFFVDKKQLKTNSNFLSGFKGIFKTLEGGGKCTICQREFTFYANARRHYANTHSTYDRSAQCLVCNSTYKNKNALKEHQRIKHGVYQRQLHQPLEWREFKFLFVCLKFIFPSINIEI